MLSKLKVRLWTKKMLKRQKKIKRLREGGKTSPEALALRQLRSGKRDSLLATPCTKLEGA